jgi:ribonucleoside-diphosphate reductase alpha chain
MPTASTSQIMGFNESFEPITNNIFQRKTLSGEFIVINKYLIKDLIDMGLWNKEMRDTIILHEGSIQNIPNIDANMKELYKTSWEIKQRVIIDMSADRGRYICQTQSLNIFIEEPDFQKLSSMHFYVLDFTHLSAPLPMAHRMQLQVVSGVAVSGIAA